MHQHCAYLKLCMRVIIRVKLQTNGNGKNWTSSTDKAKLVENRKPRYKSSIVQGFPG